MSDAKYLPAPVYRNGQTQSGEIVPRQYFEPPPVGKPPEEEEPEGLITYWRVLWRHKAVLILTATLGAIVGAVRTLPQTPVYQATVSIEMQGINEDFLNMRSMNPTASANYDPAYDIMTQIRAMQSRTLLERVIKKMNERDRASLIVESNRVSAWRQALHLSQPQPPSIEDAVAGTSVDIDPSLTSRIVEIRCASVNPKVAAEFANTIASEYIDQNMENRLESTTRTADFLGKQIQELKIKLEKSEDELQRYMTTAGLMFISGEKEKENVAEEKLRKLQEEVLKAESDRVGKQSQAEMIKTLPPESISELLDDNRISDYQSRLTDLRRQIAELNIALTPAHPKVEKLQVQVEILEGALKKSRAEIIARVNNDFQAALNREKLLKIEFNLQRELVSDQAAKVIHYNILKREVDTNRQIYEAMLQRVKESGVVSAFQARGLRIMDPALPPDEPFSPNMSRSATVGMMMGMIVGVAFIFVRELSNRNLQQPGDTSFYLNIPELGVIPAATTDRKDSPGLRDDPGVLIRGELDPVELMTWNRKFSLLAEAFRTTLTSLLFSGRNGDQPQVIVLTSANPSEGKTTVTINLAIALAEIKQRVLLIDADMRRPRLENIFDLGTGPGLADLLRARTGGEGLDKAVCSTPIPGLFVMRSGRSSGVVSNLLHSSRLPELLQQLRNQFDTVVIDTPPVLHISDARVIGRMADAVLLIVRAGKTTRDAAMMVKQRFGEDRTPLLGTILNDWNPKRDVYGYKYRHYSGNVASYTQKTIPEQEKS